MSRIQLYNITFTRNNLMEDLLEIHPNSTAIIDHNILTENNVSRIVSLVSNISGIELRNITFTTKILMQSLLEIQANSIAIIENNILTENNVSRTIHSSESFSCKTC